jgi:flagellar biosynthesis/type III secretory pathway ATPase
LERASFADIKKEIGLIKQEIKQGNIEQGNNNSLDERIKAVQKKIESFATQDVSEKEKKLLREELHNVETILQKYTKEHL